MFIAKIDKSSIHSLSQTPVYVYVCVFWSCVFISPPLEESNTQPNRKISNSDTYPRTQHSTIPRNRNLLRPPREFLFFPILPGRQASEFLFSTGEPDLSPRGLNRLRAVSLQVDLSLIEYSDPRAQVRAQAPRFSLSISHNSRSNYRQKSACYWCLCSYD